MRVTEHLTVQAEHAHSKIRFLSQRSYAKPPLHFLEHNLLMHFRQFHIDQIFFHKRQSQKGRLHTNQPKDCSIISSNASVDCKPNLSFPTKSPLLFQNHCHYKSSQINNVASTASERRIHNSSLLDKETRRWNRNFPSLIDPVDSKPSPKNLTKSRHVQFT